MKTKWKQLPIERNNSRLPYTKQSLEKTYLALLTGTGIVSYSFVLLHPAQSDLQSIHSRLTLKKEMAFL